LGDIGKRGDDMEKEFLNCKKGTKKQCQQIGNPLMRNLLAIPSDAKHIKYFTDDYLNKVNLLCNVCNFFVPVEG
jgi:hypothetical protein